MKKFGFILSAIVILSIILYVTFIIAAIKIAVGGILIVVAALSLWGLWHKLEKKLD
jgi:predicted membrane protein